MELPLSLRLSVCRFVDFFGNLSLVFCHFCIMIDNCKIKKLTEFFFFLKWSKQVHNGQKGVLIFFFFKKVLLKKFVITFFVECSFTN